MIMTRNGIRCLTDNDRPNGTRNLPPVGTAGPIDGIPPNLFAHEYIIMLLGYMELIVQETNYYGDE